MKRKQTILIAVISVTIFIVSMLWVLQGAMSQKVSNSYQTLEDFAPSFLEGSIKVNETFPQVWADAYACEISAAQVEGRSLCSKLKQGIDKQSIAGIDTFIAQAKDRMPLLSYFNGLTYDEMETEAALDIDAASILKKLEIVSDIPTYLYLLQAYPAPDKTCFLQQCDGEVIEFRYPVTDDTQHIVTISAIRPEYGYVEIHSLTRDNQKQRLYYGYAKLNDAMTDIQPIVQEHVTTRHPDVCSYDSIRPNATRHSVIRELTVQLKENAPTKAQLLEKENGFNIYLCDFGVAAQDFLIGTVEKDTNHDANLFGRYSNSRLVAEINDDQYYTALTDVTYMNAADFNAYKAAVLPYAPETKKGQYVEDDAPWFIMTLNDGYPCRQSYKQPLVLTHLWIDTFTLTLQSKIPAQYQITEEPYGFGAYYCEFTPYGARVQLAASLQIVSKDVYTAMQDTDYESYQLIKELEEYVIVQVNNKYLPQFPQYERYVKDYPFLYDVKKGQSPLFKDISYIEPLLNY